MLRRPLPSGAGLLPCQICGLINKQQLANSAKRPFVTLDAGRRLAKLSQLRPSSSIQSRLFSTSPSCLKAKRTPGVGAQSLNDHEPQQQHQQQSRFAKPQASASASGTGHPDPADIADLAAAVDRVTETFLAKQGIPSEHMTLTALQACRQAAGKLPLELATPPPSANASMSLLDVGVKGRKATDSSGANPTPQLRVRDLAYQISDAAFAIIAHPPVVITPQLLQEYVNIQARLGRPETLPEVFELFAWKPTPKLVSGSLRYTERNPDSAGSAISPAIAEAAFDTAIAAKHLDAAIGIIENSYSTKASKRAKLISRALLPASMVAAAPLTLYLLASQLATFQDSFDQAMGTKIAFIGLFAYFGFTGSLGLVAMATANDQMNRLSWAEGIPLTERWIREEERAAYDKLATSFGFSDDFRAGEEEGREFLDLREFLLRKGMILDKVDLMPGMN